MAPGNSAMFLLRGAAGGAHGGGMMAAARCAAALAITTVPSQRDEVSSKIARAETVSRHVIRKTPLAAARLAVLRGDLYVSNKYGDIHYDEPHWEDTARRGDSVEVRYAHPRGGPTVERVTVSVDDPNLFALDVVARTPHVPFGSRFLTCVTFMLTRDDDEDGVEFTTRARLVWCGTPALVPAAVRRRIEAAAEAGAVEAYDAFFEAYVENDRIREGDGLLSADVERRRPLAARPQAATLSRRRKRSSFVGFLVALVSSLLANARRVLARGVGFVLGLEGIMHARLMTTIRRQRRRQTLGVSTTASERLLE